MTLRGACIGAGYFSRFHYDAWNRFPDVTMVAVCDQDATKARAAAETLHTEQWHTSASEMLNAQQLDFIDIITPPATHLELVTEAARRGLAIICQKPLAPTFREAEELVRITENHKVPFMVHENFRFQPWHREIRRLIDQGAIGDRLHSLIFRSRFGDGWGENAYLSRQPYFREMPRLLIYETGVHFIDTFRYLAGEIDGVYAIVRKLNPVIVGEDTAHLILEHTSGAIATWDANRFNESSVANPRYTFGEMLVEGNGGSIRLNGSGSLTVQPLGGPEREHHYAPSQEGFAGDCVYATQRHFIDTLSAGGLFETNGRDYLKTLAVQEAAYQSASTGNPVRGLADGTDH